MQVIQQINDSLARYFNNKWLKYFTAFLILIYFINCFTPLRLTVDSIRYFALAETVMGTWPGEFYDGKEFYPLGYPLFLVLATQLNTFTSLGICILQMLYLAGSLYFIKRMFPSVNATRLVFFTLLNFATLKLVITPLAEMQFLFFTTGALFYFDQFEKQKKWKLLLMAAFFCIASIFTRTAGVALAAALMAALFVNNRRQLAAWVRAHTGMAVLMTAIFISALVFFITGYGFQEYLSYFLYVKQDVFNYYGLTIQSHLVDWAEMFTNITYLRTRSLFPSNYGEWLYMLIGVISLILVFSRLFKKNIQVPVHVKTYLVLYSIMIFSWPFPAGRFWFPVMPLAIAVLLQPKTTATPIWLNLYKLYYITSGIVMIVSSTWLIFDKRTMAAVRDNGTWKKEYLYHFYKEPAVDSTMNKKAVYLLEKYD